MSHNIEQLYYLPVPCHIVLTQQYKLFPPITVCSTPAWLLQWGLQSDCFLAHRGFRLGICCNLSLSSQVYAFCVAIYRSIKHQALNKSEQFRAGFYTERTHHRSCQAPAYHPSGPGGSRERRKEGDKVRQESYSKQTNSTCLS